MCLRRRVEFEQDKRGKWRWREVAPNGNITAVSGQGYTRLDSARDSWLRHVEEAHRAEEVVLTDGSPQA